MLDNLANLWGVGGVVVFIVSLGKVQVDVVSIVVRQRTERPGVRILAGA